MTTPSWPPKDPDETLDYVMDWSERLPVSDVIISSSWEVPTGLIRESDTIVEQGYQQTVVWLSGGVLGASYTLTNTVSTLEGRILQQSVRIRIKTR